MAILLFRYIRGKVRENKAAKAATADESHLVPEIAPGQEATPHAFDSRIDDQANAIPPQSPEATTKAPSAANSTENARIAAEASQRRKRRWKLILGLILPNFLAAVDVTIVAPAIPIISSHFSTFDSIFSFTTLADHQRPSQRKLQLDRRRIHAHFHDVRPSVRPNRRYLRPTCCSPFPDVLDPDR